MKCILMCAIFFFSAQTFAIQDVGNKSGPSVIGGSIPTMTGAEVPSVMGIEAPIKL
ncbi:MAG: hypothetical protein U0Z75_09960 [Deinococcaceae bacterium]